MGQTHGCSLHPNYQSVGLCDGRYRDINLLGFYLILIYALENIRYIMMSCSDVSNKSTIISSFGDIVEKCCTQPAMTLNMICEMISWGMCTWIYRYGCKTTKQNPWVFKWSNLIVNSYLCKGRYCLM